MKLSSPLKFTEKLVHMKIACLVACRGRCRKLGFTDGMREERGRLIHERREREFEMREERRNSKEPKLRITD